MLLTNQYQGKGIGIGLLRIVGWIPERERGGNGLFITLVPKVYSNVFLLVGLITLGT